MLFRNRPVRDWVFGITPPYGPVMQPSSTAHPSQATMPATEARSVRPRYAAVLAAEVELIWFKPEGLDLPWIRECFPHGTGGPSDTWEPAHWPHASTFRKPLWTPTEHTYAVTLAANGHACREFICSQRSLDAYAKLDVLPIEAVLPGSIAVGQPAAAAIPGGH